MPYRLTSCILVCIIVSFNFAASDTTWDRWTTSKFYENTKLVLEGVNPFQLQYTPKERSLVLAKIECARTCSLQLECHSFNFYKNGEFYVCELLADNFCTRKGRLALQAWPGGSVWDKLTSGTSKTCIEQSFQGINKNDYCESVSPGCGGTWPNCTDCVRSCKDCLASRWYSVGGYYNCTLWPQGNFMVPIFSSCFGSRTFIIMRKVDTGTGNLKQFYFMSLSDMNRLSNLNVYNSIELFFEKSSGGYFLSTYFISEIDINGKLGNVSLKNGEDGFGLNGKTTSLDFVKVGSDPNSCGSFWLLNANNSISCPGGQVSLFGSPTLQNGQYSTGIRWPPSSGQTIFYVDVKLSF